MLTTTRAKRPKSVFVEDFAELPYPPAEVREQFLGGGEWLAPLANAAEDDGESLRLRIGPAWLGGRITREVRARIVGVHEREDAIVVSLTWYPARYPSLFPVLDGDLEIASIGEGLCRLTLSASYVPPLGEFGRSLDSALLRRVGQSTVRSFVQRLAKSLTEASKTDLRLQALIEYRVESPLDETTVKAVPYLIHLAHPKDEQALCGYKRSELDSLGPYISDVQFQCSSCWSSLE